MKRFYCTVCKKFKRVRRLPNSVVNQNATNPQDRIGYCKWHDTQAADYSKLNRKVSA